MVFERLEYKYLVSEKLMESLRADILPHVNADPNMGENKEYIVRSIYYDSPAMDSYNEKIEGVKVRQKFRIRGYDSEEESQELFLEIKNKYNNFISKSRIGFPYDKNLRSLVSNTRKHENLPSEARKFLYHYYHKTLKPVVLIVYNREAYFCKFNPALRLTFDKNLRNKLYPSYEDLFSQNLKNYLNGFFIFEVKFYQSMPGWVVNIIQKYDLNKKALSKYTMGIDSNKLPKRYSMTMSKRFRF